jgi:hypothetical protein
MGQWSRDELESAFQHYVTTAADAVARGDWTQWSELFTEDATYVEHHYGVFEGKPAITAWINSTMSPFPGMHFPIEWHVVDEERGWIVFLAWNRMPDPDGNGPYQAGSWSLLKYAGDNRFSYEEDMYNPNEFSEMLEAWQAARKKAGAGS